MFFTVFKVHEEGKKSECVNMLVLCPSVFPVICNLGEHHADINYFTLLLFIGKNYKSGYSALEKQLFSPEEVQEILWKCSYYYSLCTSQITYRFSYNLDFHTKLLLLYCLSMYPGNSHSCGIFYKEKKPHTIKETHKKKGS